MNTPVTDAIDYVYDILNDALARGDLAAVGVRRIVKNEPGAPDFNYIAVLFGGFSEIHESGMCRVNVLVDIWSQELMMGAANNPLERFKDRTELCWQLLRAQAANEPFIGPMECAMESTEPDEKKKYFFNATITVPVTVGGGI